ncbi:hypothetical protein GCM10029978_027350 [Actinoallomurus acanthiterrae]
MPTGANAAVRSAPTARPATQAGQVTIQYAKHCGSAHKITACTQRVKGGVKVYVTNHTRKTIKGYFYLEDDYRGEDYHRRRYKAMSSLKAGKTTTGTFSGCKGMYFGGYSAKKNSGSYTGPLAFGCYE